MVERFEYELDTTKPQEMWRKQVEENLAARAAMAGSAPVA
jgi:3-ketosteroid 9alpha-monooxygenase subunit A